MMPPASLLAGKLVEVGKYLGVHSLGLLLLQEMVTIDNGNLKIRNTGLEAPTLDVLLGSKGLHTNVLITSYELCRHCNLGTIPGCKKPPIPTVTTYMDA